MTTKRPTKKAPAEAGAGHPRNFSDPEVLANHFSVLYLELPEDWSNPGAGSLDGVYRQQQELAWRYLDSVAATVEEILHGDMLEAERNAMQYALSQSQQAAVMLLKAANKLLQLGPPSDARTRALVAYAQRVAIHAQVGMGLRIVRDEERQAANSKGADVRWAKDPSQRAKETACELWPVADRHGWTATQFHRAIVDAGHETPFDTARKWLTKLRQTGRC